MKANFLYGPIFYIGYLLFRITNKTFWYPYVSFRKLFVLTKGKLNDKMSKRLETQRPPYPISKNLKGVLGELSVHQIKTIAEKISTNGFYVFDTVLEPSKVDELVKFALESTAELIPVATDGTKFSKYDRTKLLSPRYQFQEHVVIQHPLIQQLTTDETLFGVAQEYLGCKPIQDLTAMWWSTVYSKQASSAAAQLYHFDMDRFKFIKFFFYLTDVDTHNGPHCYVRGSHKQMPDNLWKDGRIQDNEIFESFSKDDIVEITGRKGSIIAVDTRGLHKGKVLERGERLILQFEYTNSLFGIPHDVVALNNTINQESMDFFKAYPYTFQRFKI